MIQITEQSYLDLRALNQMVWEEDGLYYTDTLLIDPEHSDKIEQPPYYLLYDYISNYEGNKTEWPGSIIFPEQLDVYLPKQTNIVFGERVSTIYFSDESYTNSIIKVEYTFHRDEKGLLLYKDRVISWKLSNGNWSTNTKPLKIPVSSKTEKLKEVKIRRQNIIDGLKGLAAEMGIESRIVELFSKYQLEADLYLQTGTDSLYKAIQNDVTTLWLDAPLPNGLIARDALLLHLQHGIIS